jgi:aspartyl/asparaginyl-tRNA synthetase
MLREYWLNRIALACGVLGAVLLFYYALLAAPSAATIGQLGKEALDKKVIVQARVDSAFSKGQTLFFTLDDGNKIKAVKMSPSAMDKFFVQKDAFVVVTGKVQEYEGSLELVAEKIEPAE